MPDIAISVEQLSKRYRLGEVGATSLRESAERWWHRVRGRDPRQAMEKVGGGSSGLPVAGSCASRDHEPIANNELWALRDVSFEVRRGDVLGVIGRNGAGKSTLLKILTRITEPTSGRAILRGRVASLLEVGTGFHHELTGRDNVFLSGAILGMKRHEIASRFDDIVSFSGIERFIDTPVKRYSSGMYVRLAFAVAAHLDPDILLVDEVLAVGDAAFQRQCLGKMSHVATEGRTVLFVSHNMVAVESLCRRALLMEQGRLVLDAPTKQVVGQYLRSEAVDTGELTFAAATSAPGNEQVRIKRVAVLQDGDTGDGTAIPMESPFRIVTEYWKLQAGDELSVTCHMINQDNITVFSHGCPVQASATGCYRATCHVPGNLLNSGLYYPRILIVRNRADCIYRLDQTVAVTIIDRRARDFSFMGREPSVIAPVLAWELEALDLNV